MTTPAQSTHEFPMGALRARIRRHPRRAGFVLFNLFAVLLLVWALFAIGATGVDQWPTLVLLYGIAPLIGLIWIGMWVSWGVFLLWRHRPH